jgi:serine/threonine protein kinase
MQDGVLGKDHDIFLMDPLDTWTPEARGSSARVFLGAVRLVNGNRRLAAVKFMRPDEVDYATPMFIEEAAILNELKDTAGVMRLLEPGFVNLENPEEIPPDTDSGTARNLSGQLARFQLEETGTFLEQMASRLAEGWLPYLVLERKYKQNNLLLLCDKNRNRGQYFPVEKGLLCAINACGILQNAHAHNVVYRDHKIIHYYWEEEEQRLTLIDWNVAMRHPNGLSEDDIHLDLTEFAARTLHYILTGRAASGALPVGPTRPEEIEKNHRLYEASWTYDDRKHLNQRIRQVLANALSGQYASAQALGEALDALCMP